MPIRQQQIWVPKASKSSEEQKSDNVENRKTEREQEGKVGGKWWMKKRRIERIIKEGRKPAQKETTKRKKLKIENKRGDKNGECQEE